MADSLHVDLETNLLHCGYFDIADELMSRNITYTTKPTTNLDKKQQLKQYDKKLQSKPQNIGQQFKTASEELFSSTITSISSENANNINISDHSTTSEANITTKEEITNDLDILTLRLKTQVTSISTALNNEKEVLNSIGTNVDKTSTTMVSVTERLQNVVSGGWWDIFTHMAMLFTALIIFAAVMSLMFVVPKAKWL